MRYLCCARIISSLTSVQNSVRLIVVIGFIFFFEWTCLFEADICLSEYVHEDQYISQAFELIGNSLCPNN